MVLMAVGWMIGISVQFWNRKEIFLFSSMYRMPPGPTQSPV